jgi:hypothetical protein
MKNINDINELLLKYKTATERKAERFEQWTAGGKADLVKDTLITLSKQVMSTNEYFRNNLLVGETYQTVVVNDKTLSSKTMRNIYMKSGSTSIASYASVAERSSHSISEHGFQIIFAPLLNGKISVCAIENCIDEQEGKYHQIEIIDFLSYLTEERIIELTYRGLERTLNSSHLFLLDEQV